MVFMNAGQLDHRNIGSHVTLTLDDGVTISGALAIISQLGAQTSLLLAYDDEEIRISSASQVDVNLAPAAAYTLHMKNAVEDLLAEFRAKKAAE